MEPESLFELLRKRWWVILAVAFFVAAATLLFSLIQVPVYRATSTLIVGPSRNVEDIDEVIDSLNTLDRRSVMATFAEIPSSRRVRDQAMQALSISGSDKYDYYIRASVLPDTNILEISVQGPSPESATRVADAVAQKSITFVDAVYDTFGLQTLDSASASSRPIKPRVSRNLGLSIPFGIFLGFIVALGFEWIHRPSPSEG